MDKKPRVLGRELSTLLLAVAAIVFCLVLLPRSSEAQIGGSAGQDSNCPGAQVVSTITGDRHPPPFSITGNPFRITSTVAGSASGNEIFFRILVQDERGDVIATIDQQQEGTGVWLVNGGPGRFLLDILASPAVTEFTVTVEDCTGTSQGAVSLNGQNPTTLPTIPQSKAVTPSPPKGQLAPSGGISPGIVVLFALGTGALLVGGGLLVRGIVR